MAVITARHVKMKARSPRDAVGAVGPLCALPGKWRVLSVVPFARVAEQLAGASANCCSCANGCVPTSSSKCKPRAPRRIVLRNVALARRRVGEIEEHQFLGAAAQERQRARYDLNVVVSQLEELYVELFGRRGKERG